jgi:hypothetical protein
MELAKSLKDMIQAKGKIASVDYQKTFLDLRDASDMVRFTLLISRLTLIGLDFIRLHLLLWSNVLDLSDE